MAEGRYLSDRAFQSNSLDGLRGFAALIVFFSHASAVGAHCLFGLDLTGSGGNGVFLFFVLSSFLLTQPFLSGANDAFSVRHLQIYFARRFLRIYPLYFLFLLCGLVTTLTIWRLGYLPAPFGVPVTLSVREFFNHLFLLQGKSITWSVAVEFKYYFLLPLVAFVFAKVLRNSLSMSIVATTVLVCLCRFLAPQLNGNDHVLHLGTYLPAFLIGSLTAVMHTFWRRRRISTRAKSAMLIESAGIACLFAALTFIPSVSSAIAGKRLAEGLTIDGITLRSCVCGTLLFACLNGVGILRRIFELPLLRYVGFISFGFYLFHFTVIWAVLKVRFLPKPVMGWTMLVVSLALASLSYRILEKPLSRFGASLSRNGRPGSVNPDSVCKENTSPSTGPTAIGRESPG